MPLPSIGDSKFSNRSQDQVLVSIIVVVLQHRDELCRVLDSILNHRSPEIEIIVIDGGSTDGTVEILEALDSQIAYWVSEPDRGIYDAMNKGIAAARGTYIYHINAGDRLLCLPVNELRDADANGVDVVSFMVSVDNSKHFRPSCGWRLRLTNTLHHQGTFYRRAKFPGYDLRFKVFADFDVNQRTVSATGKVQALRHCCCRSQQQRSVKLQAAPWRDIPCNCFELWDPIRSAGLGTFSIRWYKDSSRKAGRWSRQIGNFLDKSLKS